MPRAHKKRERRSLRRLFNRRRSPPGTAPGTVVVAPDARPPVLNVFAYNGERCIEAQPKSVAEIQPFLDKYPVTWANVDGLGDQGHEVVGAVRETRVVERAALLGHPDGAALEVGDEPLGQSPLGLVHGGRRVRGRLPPGGPDEHRDHPGGQREPDG